MISIALEKRAPGAKLGSLRRTGTIPAVMYGPKNPSTSVTVNEIEFIKAFRQAGESTVIVANLDGTEHETLVHDMDLDPVSGKIRHIDFLVLEKGKKITLHVPLEYVGEAAAVKTFGALLVKVLHEVEIEAMPKDLPHEIKVDISKLVDLESQIKASDLDLPSGVELKTDADEIIAIVAAAKEEVEEVAAPVDLSAIELSEKKGKKEEEGEAPADEAKK
ncbi:MAG: 50S ribosomal protein L25 [bacterium]